MRMRGAVRDRRNRSHPGDGGTPGAIAVHAVFDGALEEERHWDEAPLHRSRDQWEPYYPSPWLLALFTLGGIAAWTLLGLGLVALWRQL